MSEEYMTTFARARGGITVTGAMYEVKIALWLFLRGLAKRINFQLACNAENLGNFDDIFFKYEEDGKWKAILLQLKHKEKAELDEKFLFDKLLCQCCDSYVEINKNFQNFKKKQDIFKELATSDLHFVIFTNGKLPEKHCKLKSSNNHLLNQYLNVNLYLNEEAGKKASYFHEEYHERCICESFKESASYVMRSNSALKSYFEEKFGTNDNKKIMSAIKQLTNKEVINMLDGETELYREYRKFLSEVVLFHNQPNEKELDEFILDEIKDVSDFNPHEVYNELLHYFTAWHGKSNIVLTKNNIYQVLEEYSKPNTMLRKYFDNKTYISRYIYKAEEYNNEFVVNSVEDISDKTPMIIAGGAGMGKTTFINNLFQLNSKNLWLHKIKLNVSHKILKEYVGRDNKELLKKFIPYINETKSEYMVSLLSENNKKLLLMVDGFDEIDECFNRKITNFLKFLSTKCQLIVTTRINYAQYLTDELNGNLYYLKGLYEEDCIFFIKNHCNLKNKEELLQNIESIFGNRPTFLYYFILENPLHFQMYLEYKNNLFDEDKRQNNPDSLYTLYKSFIDDKIKIYLSRNGMEDVSETSRIFHRLDNAIKEAHKYYAIQYLNKDKDKYYHQLEVEKFLLKDDLVTIGFIDYFDSKQQPHFIHRTFAEYFYAIHLSEHSDDDEEYCKIITKHVNLKHNDFLGEILNTGIIYDSAKLFNIIDDDIDLFKRNKELNQKDAFGRTSLHLAFGVGAIEIATFLINNNFYEGIPEDIKGDTALHYLIENKINFNVDVIKKLINKCGVNCVNIRKNTPLHVAAENDFLEIIDLLMKEIDCNVNMKNIAGDTPLLIAIQCNHIEIVEKLLTNDKCDPNLCNNYRANPLIIAAQNGHKKLIELLIKSKKLDTNCIGPLGNIPLHLAAFNNYPEVVDLLLKEKVNEVNSFNEDKCTPLYYATMIRNTEVVKILLSYDECDVNFLDVDNQTALHKAVGDGRLHIVDLLINHKTCNVNALNEENETPIHIAIRKNFIDIVHLLMINEKCDINLINYNWLNNKKDDSFRVAVLKDNKDTIKVMINDEECNFNVALHLAIRLNLLKLVELLLIEKRKFNIDFLNDKNITPLHMAARFGNLEIFELLLNEGNCDINCVTHNNETPLHLAVESSKYLKIVELLMHREDCDLNCCNWCNDTPLHIAVRKRNFDIVKLLINKSQCILDCKNNNGETPIMIATTNEFTDIINLLRNKSERL